MEKNRYNDLSKRGDILKYGQPNDLKEVLDRAEELYGDRIIFSEKSDGVIMSYGVRKFKEDVEALGTKLLEMGMKGKHIAIIGENSYAWVVSFFAIVNGVGVAVPLDKELPDEDIAKMIVKGDVDAVFCSDTYISSMKKIKKEVERLEYVIGFNKIPEADGFLNFKALIKEGRQMVRRKDTSYTDVKIDKDAFAVLIFTSGTTGANKGVMLCHRNFAAIAYMVAHDVKIGAVTISVLPIHHTYELGCSIIGGIYMGTKICFNDSLKYLISNLDLYKPQMSCMVPLFLETMYKTIWQEAEKMELDKYIKYGLMISRTLKKMGIDVRRKFFKPILNKFGGNLDTIICGGAPLREDIAKGFYDFGIEVSNGLGITECSPLISVNQVMQKESKSVGKPLVGVSVKIGEPDKDGNGEILVKGDNVMLGYYKDEESTKVSFTEDGWFRTGDYGTLDKKGRVVITGRKKNLIILDNGKNVYPEEIENEILTNVPYVKEVIVYAEDNKEIVKNNKGVIAAEIVFDKEYVENNALSNVELLIHNDMKRVNKKLPSYKQVHYINISENEFEKTTTKKIKRHKALEAKKEGETQHVG